MQVKTRKLYNALLDHIAQLNGVPSAAENFSVDPTIQQTLETRIQESSAFLGQINIIPVTEQSGQKLGLGVSGPVAGTTDTSKNDRQTRDLSALDEFNRYLCTKTDFDTHITYQKLDLWAKFADFQTRVRDVILRQQALDRIMIGWNGTSRADTSDPTANPLLQDVNKGWLQHYREYAPGRVLHEVKSGSGKVVIGDTGDYRTLDSLVFDLVHSLLDPWFTEDPDMVVICGRRLLADKYFPILNAPNNPVNRLAADVIVSQRRIGNMPAVTVPFFPPNALMVTKLSNLSIYYQEGGRRRTIIDNARRDRVENFESSNDAYVIENYGAGCVVENIDILDGPPSEAQAAAAGGHA